MAFAVSYIAVVAGNGGVDYTEFVDPYIGTGGHGHVFVGANVPFGMVQVGPTSIPQSWDWSSGYHESDSTIIGFSHTHLSGTGCIDLFDITVMPVTGDVTYARGEEKTPNSGLWSYADRSQEHVEPGYYTVPLLRYDVKAEMTATPRVGMHRYTFPQSDSAAIVFDLENGGGDRATDTNIRQISDTRVVGWRHSSGWARDQKVYFCADFSKPVKLENINDRYGRVNFKTRKGEQVMMKVALSPNSIEGAEANLKSELPGWDFETTRKNAKRLWNNELEKIKVKTSDAAAKRILYTALYHTMIGPSLYSDVNEAPRYTTFSLWDTYRAAMPLFTIIHPERNADVINTMLDICDKQGRLPVWHLWGNETDCMVGNPGIPVVADAIVKDMPGFDKKRAFDAIKQTAMHRGRGNGFRIDRGYIPCDSFNEAVAYDMEYALADGAAANAAKSLGKHDDEKYFRERSHSYRNYFDKTTGFMRGRDGKGGWRTPFNPFASTHRADDYCEGNAWQYTWLVPHDVKGLTECFGSRESALAKLDSLFTVSSDIAGGESSPDISGLIGQYAHGNEPSHHILYLYTMLGQPWKTADKVRQVLYELYDDAPEGLSGNEDVGQMSAWYIMSAMGFYEVEPAGGRYWFGSPIFDKAEIKVPGGSMKIVAKNNSPENKYIQKVWLNGKAHAKPFITHADLIAGGELKFEMGPTPKIWYSPDVEY